MSLSPSLTMRICIGSVTPISVLKCSPTIRSTPVPIPVRDCHEESSFIALTTTVPPTVAAAVRRSSTAPARSSASSSDAAASAARCVSGRPPMLPSTEPWRSIMTTLQSSWTRRVAQVVRRTQTATMACSATARRPAWVEAVRPAPIRRVRMATDAARQVAMTQTTMIAFPVHPSGRRARSTETAARINVAAPVVGRPASS